MTDMIAAEPYVARRILERLAPVDSPAAVLADAIAAAVDAGQPVIVTGCGTSEHGAQGFVDIVADALRAAGKSWRRVVAAQAFELANESPPDGLVIGISHEGGTWATSLAMERSKHAGARVGLVTVSDRSPAARLADPGLVVETAELDQSWCHTVGYVSPLLAGAAVAGHLAGVDPSPGIAAALMARGLTTEGDAETVAAALAGATHLIVVASGADRPAGRELTLKVEEGSWLPSAYRDAETMLHGHLPATGAETGLVAIVADRDGRDARVARMRRVLAAARVLGVKSSAIVAEGAAASIEDDLTPAGRLIVPEAPGLSAPVAALLGSAIPLQLLAERLARARGTNPDPIRRDDPSYRDAAAAAESA
jgi:fructoselysine-6-P-deglycase FrlB-like protein